MTITGAGNVLRLARKWKDARSLYLRCPSDKNHDDLSSAERKLAEAIGKLDAAERKSTDEYWRQPK